MLGRVRGKIKVRTGAVCNRQRFLDRSNRRGYNRSGSARSSIGQSASLRSLKLQVRILPGAFTPPASYPQAIHAVENSPPATSRRASVALNSRPTRTGRLMNRFLLPVVISCLVVCIAAQNAPKKPARFESLKAVLLALPSDKFPTSDSSNDIKRKDCEAYINATYSGIPVSERLTVEKVHTEHKGGNKETGRTRVLTKQYYFSVKGTKFDAIVTLYFDDSEKATVAGFKDGKEIAVTGELDKVAMGTNGDTVLFRITLIHCRNK
jgi:hypothetical protein